MKKGWIKLLRSLLDWEWYEDHNATRLLIHLLLTVNHEDKKWKGMLIKAGSRVTSFEELADETGLTIKQTRVAMMKLENSKEVARETARKGQVVSLTKWEKFQSDEEKRASTGATKGQDEGNQRASTKELEEDKNVKKDISFLDFWNAYDKKTARPKCEKLWSRLSELDRLAIMVHVPKYKQAQPDKQYRKHPETYLRNRSWEDEVISSVSAAQANSKQVVAL